MVDVNSGMSLLTQTNTILVKATSVSTHSVELVVLTFFVIYRQTKP